MNNFQIKEILNIISKKIQYRKDISYYVDIIDLLINEESIGLINDFYHDLHLKFGAINDIVILFEKLIEKDYAPYQCYYNFAVVFNANNHYYDNKCLNALKKCLKLNPYFADAIFHLAHAFEENHDLKNSMKFYLEYLKYSPKDIFYVQAVNSLLNLTK